MKATFLILASFSVGIALAAAIIYLYVKNFDRIMRFVESKI